MFIKILLAVALFYIAAMIAIYFAQALFIYAPQMPTRALVATPADIGLEFEDLALQTIDNEKINAWYIPTSKPSTETIKTVLFFHGNAGNISHRLETIKIYNNLGFNFLIFDYRGFGISTGKPSEQGTYLDADAVWKYLIEERKLESTDIIIAGRSLGGGVAAELAKKVHPALLILESTFTSMTEVSAKHYPFMPTGLIVKHEYETNLKLKDIHCPIIFVHSKNDEVIPYEHSQRNYAAANEPKQFIELRGGHGSGFLLSKNDYVNGLHRALNEML
ncbi:MAG: alpha/beta fold hydrolase [Gammaproteobacteria bacterium]|nr:MAG: alpha/beta fold hydrolase [Gammaproteobacteria bacterium]